MKEWQLALASPALHLPMMIISAVLIIRAFNIKRVAIWDATPSFARADFLSLFAVAGGFFGNIAPPRISALLFRIYMRAGLLSGCGLFAPNAFPRYSGFFEWVARRITFTPAHDQTVTSAPMVLPSSPIVSDASVSPAPSVSGTSACSPSASSMASVPAPVISVDTPISAVQPVSQMGGAFSDRFCQSLLSRIASTRAEMNNAYFHGRRAKAVALSKSDVLFRNGAPVVSSTDQAEGTMCWKRREIYCDRRGASKRHREKCYNVGDFLDLSNGGGFGAPSPYPRPAANCFYQS